MTRFKRIIRNALKGTSIVKRFPKGDMTHPIETVTYNMNPFKSLVYFYMQFIIKDYIWEKYPMYIKGMFESRRIKDVWYLDLGDYVIRSMPSTNGEKPLVNGVFKQSKLNRKELFNGFIQEATCKPSFQPLAENNVKHGPSLKKVSGHIKPGNERRIPQKSVGECGSGYKEGSVECCGGNAERNRSTKDSCKCSLRKVPGTGKVKELKKIKGGIVK